MIDQRQQLADGILSIDPNLEFWQSEYCILEGNDEINGNGAILESILPCTLPG
jgi:hypothetical protein